MSALIFGILDVLKIGYNGPTATCYCGRVKYKINTIRPRASLACTCDSCRRFIGSLLHTVTIVSYDEVEVTQGAEFIKGICRKAPNEDNEEDGTWAVGDEPDEKTRFFCGACGSSLLLKIPREDGNHLMATFHGVYDDQAAWINKELWNPFGPRGRWAWRDENVSEWLNDKLEAHFD